MGKTHLPLKFTIIRDEPFVMLMWAVKMTRLISLYCCILFASALDLRERQQNSLIPPTISDHTTPQVDTELREPLQHANPIALMSHQLPPPDLLHGATDPRQAGGEGRAPPRETNDNGGLSSVVDALSLLNVAIYNVFSQSTGNTSRYSVQVWADHPAFQEALSRHASPILLALRPDREDPNDGTKVDSITDQSKQLYSLVFSPHTFSSETERPTSEIAGRIQALAAHVGWNDPPSAMHVVALMEDLSSSLDVSTLPCLEALTSDGAGGEGQACSIGVSMHSPGQALTFAGHHVAGSWAIGSSSLVELHELPRHLNVVSYPTALVDLIMHGFTTEQHNVGVIDPNGDWEKVTLEDRATSLFHNVMLEMGVNADGDSWDSIPAADPPAGAFVDDMTSLKDRSKRQGWAAFRNRINKDFYGSFADRVKPPVLLESDNTEPEDDIEFFPIGEETTINIGSQAPRLAQDWTAFLETKATSLAKGSFFLEMLLKPVMFSVFKPIVNTVVNTLAPSIMENTQENFQHRLVEQLPTDVAKIISNKGTPVIVEGLSKYLSSSLIKSLSPVLIRELAGPLRDKLPDKVIPTTVDRATKTIADTVVNRVSKELGDEIVSGVNKALGSVLRRSIPHALVSTLAAVLRPVDLPPKDPTVFAAQAAHCHVCEAMRTGNVAAAGASRGDVGAAFPSVDRDVALAQLTDIFWSGGTNGPVPDSLACVLCEQGSEGDAETRVKVTQYMAHYYTEYYSRYYSRYYGKEPAPSTPPSNKQPQQHTP